MENLSIKISTSSYKGKLNGLVILEGDLSIQNSNEIKEKILKTIWKHDNVRVIMKNVSDIDLTVFQLFYALKKHNNNLKLSEFTFKLSTPIFSHVHSSGILGDFEIFNN